MGERVKKRLNRKNVFLGFLDKITFFQIFVFWIMMTLNFGIVFFLLSTQPDNTIEYRGKMIEPNVAGLENSIYYSFITVTTTGYGDLSPNGLAKLFAVFEVIFGVIIQGVVVSKLVGFKQETILEEIYSINFEEAFTNFRRGLSLVRTDILIIIEKLENNTIKPREIRDLWVIFTGLDQTLTNIKNLAIPTKDNTYNKVLDSSKLELILNSMKLSMHKVLELIKTLKAHNIEWREELVLSSINFDINICREIADFELKRTIDLKLIEKVNILKGVLDEIEAQIKAPGLKQAHAAKTEAHPAVEERQPDSLPAEVSQENQVQTEPGDYSSDIHDPREFDHAPTPGSGKGNEGFKDFL